MEEAAQLGTKKKSGKLGTHAVSLWHFCCRKCIPLCCLTCTQADLCCFVVISSSDIILVHFGECVLIWFCVSLGLWLVVTLKEYIIYLITNLVSCLHHCPKFCFGLCACLCLYLIRKRVEYLGGPKRFIILMNIIQRGRDTILGKRGGWWGREMWEKLAELQRKGSLEMPNQDKSYKKALLSTLTLSITTLVINVWCRITLHIILQFYKYKQFFHLTS